MAVKNHPEQPYLLEALLSPQKQRNSLLDVELRKVSGMNSVYKPPAD